ncbi:SMI1/KNR4 family protein [Hymenobacter lapidiphilus]|uniref:SMI1/KNR4 family protein n=1 Tax=Hymenobacter lapidiphilus TaxID=2608003 RepID=A0A7Y7PM60_9BACT|nr:SMI1/KNR4 family protein [Hymenobacter lapidiphilus]NVO30363.1 SMI1/KNR4 family protein [Hymenobacter lapidiphilus]
MIFLTQTDFNRLEQELRVELPVYYKNFHLQETELIQKMRQGPLTDQEHLSLATDAEWLLQTNKEIGVPRQVGPCRGKFCIGTDGGGNDFFISLETSADTTVYQAAHDGFPREEIYDEEIDDFIWSHEGLHMGQDLKDFVKQDIQANKEYEENQE